MRKHASAVDWEGLANYLISGLHGTTCLFILAPQGIGLRPSCCQLLFQSLPLTPRTLLLCLHLQGKGNVDWDCTASLSAMLQLLP